MTGRNNLALLPFPIMTAMGFNTSSKEQEYYEFTPISVHPCLERKSSFAIQTSHFGQNVNRSPLDENSIPVTDEISCIMSLCGTILLVEFLIDLKLIFRITFYLFLDWNTEVIGG
jgi:hypothetical protein